MPDNSVSEKYVVYVGTARGTVIYTNCKQDEAAKYEIPEKTAEITSMEWGRSDNEIIIGHSDGTVKMFDTAGNKFVKSESLDDSFVVGVGCISSVIVAGSVKGYVHLLENEQKDGFSLGLGEKGTLNCLVCHKSRENIVGTGGECNDFKLWDVNTKQCVFKAKSLGHDFLNLPIPTSVRGVAFIPNEEHLSCCATKEGHVLLYDDRAQRRPVVKFNEQKASYTTITSTFRERQVMVGTAKGYMQLLDLKSPGKCLKTFKTFTGSVTSIACDPLEPLVVSTSLDRYLRIHNMETKELLHKEYMKQNLTKLLVKPIVKNEEPAEVKEVDEEYETIFESMETVSDTKKPKKRKNVAETQKVVKTNKKKIIDVAA